MNLRWIQQTWLPMFCVCSMAAHAALAQTADLSLGLASTGVAAPAVGRPLTWLIYVTNRGPATATSVVVSNPLPATVSFLDASSGQGEAGLVDGAVVGNFSALESSAVASITLNVRPEFSGSLTQIVAVSAFETDPDPANNVATRVYDVQPAWVYVMAPKDTLTEGDSGTTNVVFTVWADAPNGLTASVDYATIVGSGRDQSATPGLDFTPVSGTLVFPPGTTNLTFTVPVLGDLLDEFNETIVVVLSNPVNFRIAQGGFASKSIIDDDAAPVVSVSSATVVEGDAETAPAVFTVSLSAPSGKFPSVRFTTVDGSAEAGTDYVAANVVLTFSEGTTSRTVPVLVRGNTVFEGDETFQVRLTNPFSLTWDGIEGQGVIQDDDAVAGRLDHFQWSTVASPRVAGVPFEAIVTAVDAFSNPVTDFDDTVPLRALGVADQANLTVTPDTLTGFVNGVWRGTIAVSEVHPSVVLRADAGLEHVGDSDAFAVVPTPILLLELPLEAIEGDGTIIGTVSLLTELPRTEDLELSVVLSNPGQVLTSGVLVIPIGETNATLFLTVVDDTLLDGSQPVTATVSASGTIEGVHNLTIHDNETTDLTLVLPELVLESAGVVSGFLEVARAPDLDVQVEVFSSVPFKIQVPATLVLPAGATSVPFDLTVVDNAFIDPAQSVEFTATVRHWNRALGTVMVEDDEGTNLVLTLPESSIEGQGTLIGAGRIEIDGILGTPLSVGLSSSGPDLLGVPASVIIPAGANSVTFNVSILNNGEREGTRTIVVTAQSPGFASAMQSMRVVDNDPARLTIDPIPSPQTSGVPFQVQVRLFDANGLPAVGFTGTALLRAWAPGALPPITPTTAGPFVDGVWTGFVTVNHIETEVQISAEQMPGVNDLSSPFLLKAPPVQVVNVARIRDLVYSPHIGKAYVSVKGDRNFISSIAWLDPETGGMQHWKDPYFYPDRLALSRDGQMLFVIFPWDGGYGRIQVSNGFEVLCSFGSTYIQPTSVPWQTEDFDVLDQPHLLVASRYFFFNGGFWTASAHHGIATYPAGYPLPDVFSPGGFGMRLTTSEDGKTVYCTWPEGYAQLESTPAGLSPVKVVTQYQYRVPAFENGFAGDLVYDRGLLYRDNGEILDPVRLEKVGRFASSGLLRPDSSINRVLVLAHDGPAGTWQLHAYDQATQVSLGTLNLHQVVGTPSSLTRCGSNTTAFVTSGEQLFLLHGIFLPTQPETDLAVSLQLDTPAVTLGQTTLLNLALANNGTEPANNLVLSLRIPASLGPIHVVGGDDSCAWEDGALVCRLDAYPSGTSGAIQIEVPTRVAGRFRCVASVASNAREPDFLNNVSTLELIVPGGEESTPRLEGIATDAAGVRVWFPTRGGDHYRLESSTTLETDSWEPAADYIYGTGQTLEVRVPYLGKSPTGFYRLTRVQDP